jgi:hypothetical protein
MYCALARKSYVAVLDRPLLRPFRTTRGCPQWRGGCPLYGGGCPRWLTEAVSVLVRVFFTANCPHTPISPLIIGQNALFHRYPTPQRRKTVPFAAHNLALRTDLPRSPFWPA